MIKPIYKRVITQRLRELQYPNGLFSASSKDVSTGYNVAWIRDNIYEALGLETNKDIQSIKRTYHALFDIFRKYEFKIDWILKEKPVMGFQYIHPRYDPHNYEEIEGPWGWKQNDAIGAFLFKVGDLYQKGIKVFRDEKDVEIIQKLVHYLASIEYWHDPDNGVWENEEEVHASSIGACVAGLKAVQSLVYVPEVLIQYGQKALDEMLPRESHTKETDLALLTLIYPFNVVNDNQRAEILWNVEKKLVRERGVVRYDGDPYYSNGSEAEWCFGLPWLAKIYKDMGNMEKYKHYIKMTHKVINQDYDIPELYYADSAMHNENTPLGWAAAMYLIAVS